ncbi:VOC family protein [Blastococcus sp. TF02A-30]|uniref:VOC family protein n=1 Tax=Blastococcus sp. TF02A-30 TaxID=2250580 RepID=UPI000DEA7AB1|nr:VOC family protein [Blastococcus sp. TF02A-30]RBY83497.1 VOC family protein [Blastococcus sp. TF02A-30]
MSFDVQIVVDSSSPHALADWWAETLGWQVEPQDEAFIRRMVEQGAARESDTTTHRGALVWRAGAAITSPEPGRPRVLFQLVPEAKTVKNRLHLDVRVGDEAREPEVARLVERGARELWRGAQGPFTWVTLADPEGNEFCVA